MTNAWEQFGAGPVATSGSIEVLSTDTGYAVREIPKRRDYDAILETVLRFTGVVMLLMAAGQWVLPGVLFGADMMPTRLGLTSVLGMTGFVFFWLAARGLKTQMEVDPKERQIRLVYLNSRGHTRPQKTFGMRDLESFYVKRTKNPMEPAALYLRLRGTQEVRVVSGTEYDLTRLHERMCGDLQPAKRRAAMRPAPEKPAPEKAVEAKVTSLFKVA
jgi:hypothetical protein